MRPGIGAVIVVLLGSAVAPVGAAEFGTVFVVPGRPGVPVVINGWDASFTVVEGEFGLDRPGQVNPVIVGNPMLAPSPLHYGPYFPRAGRQPGYGRHEIEPPANRRLPPPAQSYYRSWSSQSEPLPASLDPPATPPEVNVNVDPNDQGSGNGDKDLRRDDKERDKELRRKERETRRADREKRRHRVKRRHHGGGHHH